MAPGLEYAERPAPASLSDAVACVWSSRVASGPAHLLRTLPDGCVEVVFSADRPTLLYGPDAAWADVPLEGGRAYHGIRLRPGRAGPLLGLDPAELSGRVVEAADVLKDVSLDQRSAEGWTRSLFGHLSSLRRPAFDSMVVEAVGEIAREPRLQLPDLAKRLAISERQLRRRFARSVGLPPSTFARVAGMHHALRLAARRDRLWGTVAYDAGFSDQAHLSREIHALTGHSPAVLLPRPAPAH